jgi:uncharacterized protein
MTTAVPRGRFVWYDLLTTDPARAIAFYTQLVGWGTEQWAGPKPYTMWTANGKPMGGTMQLPAEATSAGAKPHWMAYISTPDVDGTVKQATKLGARVQAPPTDIPTVGRYSTLADPDGAIFAVYTPANYVAPPAAPPKVQEFSWHELIARDYKRAFEFYSALFGWEKLSAHDMGSPFGVYQIYGLAGQPLGGMYSASSGAPQPAHWLYYVRVDDVDRLAPRVAQLGGKLCHGPVEVPGGSRIAICTDPQGADFALNSGGGPQ